ncbi:MAG: hypothetical protein ABWY12_00575 [Burkholderiales bacterium]
MGLDDRDYMRERYRKRRGLSSENTRWNSKKSRVERDDVPLGSASWIGKDPGKEFEIITGDRKAVVQLLNQRSEPIFATYVRENDVAHVLVPRGTWTLRLIEGRTWHGDDEFFGSNTVTEDAIEKWDFTGPGRGIDLRRRINGAVKTVNRWSDPTF